MTNRRTFFSSGLITTIAGMIGIGMPMGAAPPANITPSRLDARRLSSLRPLPDPDFFECRDHGYGADLANGEFGRAVEYGRIPYRTLDGVELWAEVNIADQDVVAFLKADAEAHLPANTRYEVRKRVSSNGTEWGKPCPHAQRRIGRHAMAWYRHEHRCVGGDDHATDRILDFGSTPLGLTDAGAYILMGQFVTPAREDV